MSTRRTIWPLAALVILTACAAPGPADRPSRQPDPPWVESIRGDGPGTLELVAAAGDLPPGSLERSARGNASSYVVFGQRYQVRSDATGYREEGVASWYGRKFHGRETSSGEVYDMHALTAAHRSLPLPTLVRVTHLDSGHSVVVRVNDRGPFVDDRLIDLSYAAAVELDMLDTGTAPVRVEALDAQEIAALTGVPSSRQPATTPSTVESPASTPQTDGWFVRAGAFRERGNAERRQLEVGEILGGDAEVVAGESSIPYRVQIGPFDDAEAGRQAIARLARYGVEAYLATER